MGKDDLKKLIAQARLDEAVAQLLEQITAYLRASKSDKSVRNLNHLVIINSSKLHGLQRDKKQGIVDRENEKLTLAEIHIAILNVLDELPDEFWKVPPQNPTAKQDSGNDPGHKSSSTSENTNLSNLEGKDNISLQNLNNTIVRINFNSSDKKKQSNIERLDQVEQQKLHEEQAEQQRLAAQKAAAVEEEERLENEKQAKLLAEQQLKEKQQKAEQDRLEQQKFQEERAEKQRLAAQKAEEEPSISVLNLQPLSAETHRSLEDPAASLIKKIVNRKKLIYLLSPFVLIIFIYIFYIAVSDVNRVNKLAIRQSSGNIISKIDSFPIEIVLVKGGEFIMGDDNSTEKDEKPSHKVVVSDFKIGKYEVTQKQYTDIMGKNPSDFKGCDNCPVESVNCDDVQEFLEKLNQKTGKTYRLPTETEWEYACRAGTTTIFNTGNDLTTSQANYNGNNPYNNSAKGEYRKRTMIVGSFAPNDWGLYDMHGNVWEWCSDMYDENYYTKQLNDNHKVSSAGYRRVIRGGAWTSDAKDCRAANRDNTSPGNIYFAVGFRLVSGP